MAQYNYLLRQKNGFQALWCTDSESSREYLINLETNEILAERKDGKIVEYIAPKEEKL